MKTAIIVDSTSYLPEEIKNKENVFEINLLVTFSDGTTIADTGEITAVRNFYDRLDHEDSLPTTSQPAVGDYYALMDKLVADGYEAAVCIHLSSKISGTYQTARMVTQEYTDRMQVYCIDSKGASVVQEALVRTCLNLLDEGMPLDEINQRLLWLVEESVIYLLVENLNNLVKGGRLSATSALLGNILQIKPLLYFEPEGSIQLFEKIRTSKKVFKRWKEIKDEAMLKYLKGIEVSFAHADAEEEILEILPNITEGIERDEVTISILGPVVGTHTARRAKGMAIIPKLDNYPDNFK